MSHNKFHLEDVIDYIKNNDRDVKVIDKEYKNSKHSMDMFCFVCGEKFKRSFGDMKTRGRYCPYCSKNAEKITKFGISKTVNSYGYKIKKFLKSDNRHGSVFIAVCKNGHEIQSSYKRFIYNETKRSGNCRECNQNNIGYGRRNNHDIVVKNIQDCGYHVSNDFVYEDSHKKIKMTCDSGHLRFVSYNDFRRTPNCPRCTNTLFKFTEKDIEEKLSNIGMEYVKGFTTTLNYFYYKCRCGNIEKGKIYQIIKDNGCKSCSGKRSRWEYERVYNFYKENNCKLLSSEFENSKDVLVFECSCGSISKRQFSYFLKFPHCKDCGVKKRSGKNHPGWNDTLTDEERLDKRKYQEYENWRNSVFDRDFYTCQCCGDDKGGNLISHHLNSHDWAIDERIDVDNGITLCSLCHTDFHAIYGYGDNTKEQFCEYLNDIYNDIQTLTPTS